jgi:hypothetical protein
LPSDLIATRLLKAKPRLYGGVFIAEARKGRENIPPFAFRERKITNGGDGDANVGASADASDGANGGANGRDGANVLLPA